tara:strand:+ start:113 stop:436 length:324 start_codon:yes stop_codon:yes gene_type:complete
MKKDKIQEKPNIFLRRFKNDNDNEFCIDSFAKEREFLLCLIGQERPLINGKRREYTNIPTGEIAEYCGLEGGYNLLLNEYIYLEKWDYAFVDWKHEYENFINIDREC